MNSLRPQRSSLLIAALPLGLAALGAWVGGRLAGPSGWVLGALTLPAIAFAILWLNAGVLERARRARRRK